MIIINKILPWKNEKKKKKKSGKQNEKKWKLKKKATGHNRKEEEKRRLLYNTSAGKAQKKLLYRIYRKCGGGDVLTIGYAWVIEGVMINYLRKEKKLDMVCVRLSNKISDYDTWKILLKLFR